MGHSVFHGVRGKARGGAIAHYSDERLSRHAPQEIRCQDARALTHKGTLVETVKLNHANPLLISFSGQLPLLNN